MENNPPYRSADLIRERKIVSDEKNDTENLNFEKTRDYAANSIAGTKVRDFIDQKEIDALLTETNESAMLKELYKLEQEHIDNE